MTRLLSRPGAGQARPPQRGIFLVLGTILIAAIVLAIGPRPGGHGDGASNGAHADHTVARSGGVTSIEILTPRRRARATARRRREQAPRCRLGRARADRPSLDPLGWFAAGRMLRPIREITRRTRLISAGNLNERLAFEGPPDEFTELGRPSTTCSRGCRGRSTHNAALSPTPRRVADAADRGANTAAGGARGSERECGNAPRHL